jgi:DNA polymerase-2
MYDGKHDDALIYKKRLRKPVNEYVKSVPPHVKAAKKMLKPKNWGNISYVITTDGPEPIENIKNSLDYDHYLEKQITPVVVSISRAGSLSLEKALDRSDQMNLF